MSDFLHLCATTRLAQTLRAEVPGSAPAWLTCQALTPGQWFGNLAEEAVLSGIADLPEVLDPFAESLLWEKVIDASLTEAAPLFDIQGMAASAAEAHALCRVWGVTAGGAQASDEARLFAGWQREFVRKCRAGHWTDLAGLHGEVIALIEAGQLTLPDRIALAGFDRLTPQEERLIRALNARGVVFEYVPDLPVDRSKLISGLSDAWQRVLPCADSRAECAAIAAWAHERLAADPKARLGIVAPNLAGVRDSLAFMLDDVLHPAFIRPDAAEVPRCFNFSLGRSLADLPLIRVALDLLALGNGRSKVEQARLSALLLAGGWSAAVAEADERAQFDTVLRRDLPYFTTLPALLRLAGRLTETGLALCPRTVKALGAFFELMSGVPRTQRPGEWVKMFRQALQALEWPGDRPLSSHEYQARRAFGEVLDRLGHFDGLLGALSLNEAVRRLSQLCRQRIFQPETRGRPAIQVLGVLESAGLAFDALWVMGMNDDQWPPPPRPNPLLSAEALRSVGAAHASAEVELDFAQRVHARLVQAAPDVTFSYALADGNRLLRPSPLLAGIAAVDAPARLILNSAQRLAITAGSACEMLADAVAPPVADGEKVSGGSWLLRAQAICPAWAYYQYRLGAEAMEEAVEGLDPAARGTLVHAALEAFWTATRSSKALAAMGDVRRPQAIAEAVANALTTFEQDHRLALPARFRELEADRLARLLEIWLQLEGKRGLPFDVLACEQPAEVEIEGIKVKMVVDRIDQLADGRQIIIDYKTGAAVDTKNWGAQRITEPQLPIYAALVNDEVAAVVFAKVLLDKPAFAGIADEKDILPGVQGIGDDKQKIFGQAEFPDWIAVVTHWRERLHAVAREIKLGVAGVMVADEEALRYCEVLPLLRLPERRRLLARALSEVSR